MKKIYQNPELKVVTVKTAAHLLIQSNVRVGEEYGGTTVLSRKGAFFDDDEEE